MARIRSIKPEFWTDSTMVQLPAVARLFFIGLWNFADDYGYLRDEPERIRLQVFPGESTDAEALVDLLVAAERLERLETEDGQRYLRIRHFTRHQRVSHPAAPAIASSTPRRKLAIPAASRRAVATKYGCAPGGSCDATCYYCGAPGRITWWTRADGRPSAWVSFSGLELDHFAAEALGAGSEPENLVLACESCNRAKAMKSGVQYLAEGADARALRNPPESSRALRNPPPGREGKGEGGGGETDRTGEEGSSPPPDASRSSEAPPRARAREASATARPAAERSPAAQQSANGAHPAPAAPRPKGARRRLPDEAKRLLRECYGWDGGRTLTERQRAVADQLLAALGDGVKYERGLVRAVDAEHLAWACTAVLADPPDKRDVAIQWVLLKLRDTFTEQLQERARRAAQEADGEGDERRAAARAWAEAHPEVWEAKRAQVELQLGAGAKATAIGKGLLEVALEHAMIAAWEEHMAAEAESEQLAEVPP